MKLAKIVEEYSTRSSYAWHVHFEGEWKHFDSLEEAEEWCRTNGLSFVRFDAFGREVQSAPDTGQRTK